MCARYVVARASRDLVASMGLLDPEGNPFQVDERFDVRPTSAVPVVIDSVRARRAEEIVVDAPGAGPGALAESLRREVVAPRRTGALARWSLTPPFSKQLKTKFSTFNARSETVTERASFRHAVKSQRTVLIADGYYEWLTAPDGSKQPYFIHNGNGSGAEAILFAGLYSWWKDADLGEWVLTATMLTRAASGPVADIHDRTPMMLRTEDVDAWLDPHAPGTQGMVDDFSQRSIALGESLQFHRVAPLRGVGSIDWVEPLG